jgi:hypothetical protein
LTTDLCGQHVRQKIYQLDNGTQTFSAFFINEKQENFNSSEYYEYGMFCII